MKPSKTLVAIFLSLFLALAACAQPAPTAAPTTAPTATTVAPTATSVPPTAAPTAAATPTTAPARTPTLTAAPTPTPSPAPTPTPTPKTSLLFVLSQSAPHVSVIDTKTNEVIKTKELPGFTGWAYNDANNYFDGKRLWTSMRDPKTKEVAVGLLDVDTLEIVRRIPLGTDNTTLYIGKVSSKGVLFVSKHASAEVVAINTKTYEIIGTTQVEFIACDVDVAIPPDGIERVYVPNRDSRFNTVIDANTRQIIKTFVEPDGVIPTMLTVHPNGKTVWIQEGPANLNSIFDAIKWEPIARVPTGKNPVVVDFSPDGKLGYIGNASDSVVTVIDAETYKVVQTVQVGTNANDVAAHPNGKVLYVTVNREAAVVAIDTSTWQVIKRIPLGTNPSTVRIIER